MRILDTPDYEAMSRCAADLLAAQLLLQPDCVLGLATGSSPVGAYRCLAERYRSGELNFSRCYTVNLDEYCGLAPDNAQSYAAFMQKNLFSQVNLPADHTNIPGGLATDDAAECRRYDKVIRNLGGIDLQLLGIGNNGHIGFNEPADCFVRDTHRVALTDTTIAANQRFFEKREDVPTHAYTMGIGGILNARRIVLLAGGAGKAEILYRTLTGPITPAVPASILQLHPDVTIVADAAALSVLRERAPQLIG